MGEEKYGAKNETYEENAAIKADPQRIARFIREIGEIGQDPAGGWSRLAFSPEERQAHDLFSERAQETGMSVYMDAVGNTVAELPGSKPGPALMAGSHLDTVPQGGAFDGVAGVAVALEVGRLLSRETLEHPYRAIVFSGEEGPRFGAPCLGSRVATGAFTADTLRRLTDRKGRSVAECATELGLAPENASQAVWPKSSVAAFLEVHVEQGRVLESRGRQLGVVDAIAGSTRVELTFRGRSDHSGATPMTLRSDALVGASEFAVEVERRAAALRTAVATVGDLEVRPGSFTTVPGEARISLDVRDIDSDRQRELVEELLDQAMRISTRRGLELSPILISDQSPVVLHKSVREGLAEAAYELSTTFCLMPSGASHDAAHVAQVAPSGMVFVPSRDGVSHSPQESSETQDVAIAADVVKRYLKAIDKQQT